MTLSNRGWFSVLIALASCGDNVTLPPDSVIIEPPIPATLALPSSSAQFGSVKIATSSAAMTFSVQNAGMLQTGTISVILDGTDKADFAFANGCTTLAGFGSCPVTVTFAPTSTGMKSARLIITSSPGGTIYVTLAGEGTP